MRHRIFLAMALIVALAGCVHYSASVSPDEDRDAAPEFTLADANGQTVKLSDYRGQVVLLNFWATWCGPCKIEIPWFVEFEREYKDQGFAVLGVSFDENGWDAVRPYIQQADINYRVMLADDSMDEKYIGIEALPTTFVLDRDGRIAAVHTGLISRGQYESDIEAVLESSAAVQAGQQPQFAALRGESSREE